MSTDGPGITPIINPGAKPDDKGRVYRFEQWIEEWQATHAKCAPLTGSTDK